MTNNRFSSITHLSASLSQIPTDSNFANAFAATRTKVRRCGGVDIVSHNLHICVLYFANFERTGGAKLLYQLTYIEIDLICLFILLIVFSEARSHIGVRDATKMFRTAVLTCIGMVASDALWMLGESGCIPFPPVCNWLVNILYPTFGCVMAYCWFLYTEIRLAGPRAISQRLIACASIPLILITAMVLASVSTQWIFYIDAQNVYHRGTYFIAHPIVSFTYMIAAAAHAAVCGFRAQNRQRRSEAFILASFVILPVIGGYIQTSCYGVPAILAGSVLSVLMVFIRLQNVQIFNDALTGLNNRRRADEYLDISVAAALNSHRLIFFMMDINRFKQINDTFGHQEGDHALCLTSSALKTVCNEYGAFLARYGGDEFCVIWPPHGGESPEQLAKSVQTELASVRKRESLPYDLTMSIGYQELSSEADTPEKMFIGADAMLYRNKAAARIGR